MPDENTVGDSGTDVRSDDSSPALRQAEPDLQPAWQLGSAEDVLPGLVPRPAKLPGIKRWQVDKNAARTRIDCVAWCPDGSRIACGSDAGVIRIYDPSTLSLTSVFVGHTERVLAVAWSPDGTQLASTACDGTARIWNARGECTRVFDGYDETIDPSERVTCISWHPDGKLLATSGHDTKIRIWRPNGTQVKILDLSKKDVVASVAWSPDGMWLAAGGYRPGHKSLLRLWKADGTPGPELVGHPREVETIAWRPDGKMLASGGWEEGSVRLWNVDGTPGPVLDAPSPIKSLAWSRDGKQLSSGSWHADVRIWNADGSAGPILEGHQTPVLAVAWSPDGRRLLSADEHGVLRLWSAEGEAIAVMGDRNDVLSVDWNTADHRLAAGTANRIIGVLERDGIPSMSLVADQGGGADPVSCCQWSPDGQRIAGACGNNPVRIWDTDGRPGAMLPARSPRRVAWHPSGDSLAIGYCFSHELVIWNGRDDAPTQQFPLEGIAQEFAWSPDGRRLLVNVEYSAQIWNLEANDKEILPGDAHFVAWSPDGRWLAISSHHYLGLLSVENTAEAQFMRPQTERISSIAWSPDSRELVTGGYRSLRVSRSTHRKSLTPRSNPWRPSPTWSFWAWLVPGSPMRV